MVKTYISIQEFCLSFRENAFFFGDLVCFGVERTESQGYSRFLVSTQSWKTEFYWTCKTTLKRKPPHKCTPVLHAAALTFLLRSSSLSLVLISGPLLSDCC